MSILSAEEQKLICEIRKSNLTYLPNSRLASILEVIRDLERLRLPGVFVEAGCALGGSTILISSMKSQNRAVYVYDVFEMIPPPKFQDGEDVHERYKVIREGRSKGIDGDKYYGYEDNLYDKVLANLRKFGVGEEQNTVLLIKGRLQETMHLKEPVAFAHIDVDWYESVKTCLERITPMLILGGSIIIDDYFDWSGCRNATDEHFKDRLDHFKMDGSAGAMKVTRKWVNPI